jgi:hypothetical protein
MAENQKSIDGIIEKLALVADAIDSLFPDGKSAIAFELKSEDFKRVQNNFRQVDHTHKQFKIVISNTEFMFLLDGLLIDEKDRFSETLSQIKSNKDTFFEHLNNL